MQKKLLLTCLALSGFGFASISAQAEQYATAILDKTGSMQQMRTDGKSRCQYGKELFLTTVAAAMGKTDYLNVKTFGAPGELFSISNGFYKVTGLSPVVGAGKVFFDNIQTQINALRCDSSSTALGDSICDSTNEIRNYVSPSTTQVPRLAVVTDAGENYSQRCGGANYVDVHIIPRLTSPAPKVRMDVTILAPGGNVSLRSSQIQNYVPSYEIVPPATTPPSTVALGSASRLLAPSYSPEVEALIRSAKLSGGGAIVIQDNKTCTSNCDPLSQGPADDDWGGAW